MKDINPRQPCRHCGETTANWLWRLIEVYPEYLYEKLCVPCCQAQDAAFTLESALKQACAIVYLQRAVLDGRIVADGGMR